VLDASEGMTGEDRRIAARVMDLGRGLTIVANKWDLVDERDRTYQQLARAITVFAGATVTRTTATTGAGIGRLPDGLLELDRRWSTRVPTGEVNRLLGAAQEERPPPGGVRYRYATQVAAGPPTFILFGGRPPDRSYQRFLENRLRRELGLEGIPIRLRFRPKPPRAGA
ncbi:MAG TPA: hypothetical protein VE646_13545, partial [Actinomycetota bacterium]|nr:hypothetical protein [Actinomycetota bacterium]